MSISGKIAMGALRLISRFWDVAIPDPEKYLAQAQKHNRRHPFHKLKDRRAVYRYYKVNGCPVILIQSKKAALRKGKAILYLHGGITNDWEAELMVARGYANRTGMAVWYPLPPAVTQAAASDIINKIFEIYQRILSHYGAANLALIGTSFGGTFAFGLICKINQVNQHNKTRKIPMPALYIANSPGGVPQSDTDWAEMVRLSQYDPLISISAVKNIIPMQKLIAPEIPEYANSPAYGDFTEAPETYVYYAEETLAGNHLAYERAYQKYGVAEKMHMHIAPGMMHGYSCLPVFKESKAAYREQIALLKKI